MKADGTIRIDTRLNTAGLSQGLKAMTGGFAKLSTAIFGTLGLGALGGLTAILSQSVKSASEYENALIGLRSIVEGTGGSFSKAKGFLADFVKDGLIPMTNAATAYKNLAARGYNTEQIEKTLTSLKDASAFGRQAALTMGQAVQSATEGLKNENSILVDNAGVTKNVSVMWQDYANSIGKSVSELTKADKIIAEVNGIQTESRFQVGDAARITETYSGKVSMLTASFGALKRAIGEAVIPILGRIIPAITAAIRWLTGLFTQVASFMRAVFGTQVQSSLAGVTDGTNDAADAQDNLAEATNRASKAAKGALAPFDELNVLAQETNEGSMGAGGGAVVPIVPEVPEETDQLTPWAERLAAIVAGIKEFLAPVGEAFAGVWNAIKEVGSAFTEALAPMLNDEGGGWQTFITLLRDGVIVILNLTAAAFRWLADYMRENPRVVQQLISLFMVLAGAFLLLTSPIAQVIAAIAIALVVIGWIGNHFEEIKEIANKVFTAIAAWVKEAASDIQDAWKGIPEWFRSKVTDPLKNFFTDRWNAIKDAGTNAWNGIKNIWSTAIGWYTATVIDPIRNAFQSAWNFVKTAAENAFTGIGEFVKGIFNGIIGFINGLVQGAVSGVNRIIDALNGISFTIPDWVPFIGGETWGFNLPKMNVPRIPLLASGAVIPPNSQFAAILGDQTSGRNLEAPEALIRQIVREETAELGGREITIRFAGNMSALVQQLKPYLDREQKRTGSSLIGAKA